MDTALVFTWSRPETGREAKALEALIEGRMFWAKLAAEGQVSEPEYLMGIDQNMLIVKGDWDFLFQTLHTDAAMLLIEKAGFVAKDFTYHFYSVAGGAEHMLELYATAGTELGIL